MRGVAVRVATLLLALASAEAPAADRLIAAGGCRDGVAHGAYEARDSDGRMRVLGAFNRGRRTGSFIFWNADGVRVAHVPYEDDVIAGTVALWHPRAAAGGEPRQKLEASYAHGVPVGTKRSWHADGTPRSQVAYENGVVVEAQGWSPSGTPLPPKDAQAAALRDDASDAELYRSLQSLVQRHLPSCAAASPGG